MRGIKFLAIGLSWTITGIATAAEYADVVEVEPLYGMVEVPAYTQRCWHALPAGQTLAEAPERYCETVEYSTLREELVAYRVAYRYHGRIFRTKTTTHPGERIRVDAQLSPVFF